MQHQKVRGKFPTGRPPDPKRGSPGTEEAVTGADRKADVLSGTSKRYQSLSRLVQSESAIVVYDGRKFIGTIIKHEGKFEAFDANGRCLGGYYKRTDAVRAFSCGGVS
jgi:hypothetical protein